MKVKDEILEFLNNEGGSAKNTIIAHALIQELIKPLMEEAFQAGEKNIEYKTGKRSDYQTTDNPDGYFVEKVYKQNKKQWLAEKFPL